MTKKQALALCVGFALALESSLSGAFLANASEEAFEMYPDEEGDFYTALEDGNEFLADEWQGDEDDYFYEEDTYIFEETGGWYSGWDGDAEEEWNGGYGRIAGADIVEEGMEVEEGQEVTGDGGLTERGPADLETGDFIDEELLTGSETDVIGGAPSGSVVYEDVLTEVEQAVEEILKEETGRPESAKAKKKGKKSVAKKQNSSNEGAEEALERASADAAKEELFLPGVSAEDKRLDFRDLQLVKPAMNQGETNNCWAYATVGALEAGACRSLGKVAEEVDDSETYLALFTHVPRAGEGAVEYAAKQGSGAEKLENPFYTGSLSKENAAFLVSALGPAREDAFPAMPSSAEEIMETAKAGEEAQDAWLDSKALADHAVGDVCFLPEVNLWEGDIYSRDETGIQAIKLALSTGHAVVVEVYDPSKNSKYVNAERNALFVSNPKEDASHQVVIIGWDDNFSRENFNGAHRPGCDGAWICRNSWGSYETLPENVKSELLSKARGNLETLWKSYLLESKGSNSGALMEGEASDDEKADRIARWLYSRSGGDSVDADGCFYMSYEDSVYNKPTAYDVIPRSELQGETLYQYDYLGMACCTDVSNSESSGCVANVFTMDETSRLHKVSVYTAEASSDVNIEIYLLSDDAVSPVEGTKIYDRNETLTWAGYHILDLEEPLTAPKGSRIAVVLHCTGPKGHPYTPYEYGGKDPYASQYAYLVQDNVPGQSYIQKGSTWVDLADYPMDEEGTHLSHPKAGNALIKLFAAAIP